MTSIEDVNRVARALGGAAHVAYRHRDILAGELELRVLAVEVSQLLDALAGVFLSNPKERTRAHMRSIDAMLAALAPIDHGCAVSWAIVALRWQ